MEFFEPEADLVASLIEAPNPETLQQLFDRRTARWPHPIVSGECYTIGIFSDLDDALRPAEAWELIPAALELALRQTDRDRLEVALDLLLRLATVSQTTEEPPPFGRAWDSLAAHVREVGGSAARCASLLRELRRWYRVGS